MLREAFRSLFVKYLPGCDYARGIEFERKRDQEVHELRTAAKVIKAILYRGHYFDNGFPEWMCVAVAEARNRKHITSDECDITRKMIRTEIDGAGILSLHMYHSGERLETEYDHDRFVGRIARSVWYWQFIKRLQIRAVQRAAQVW
ncbi:hypothetical protein D3C72_1370240 [compost metagenome]